MSDLDSMSDAELVSVVGRANAILSRRAREKGQAFQDAVRLAAEAAWPNGCIKPGSCGRHAACMYAQSAKQCRHFGKDLVTGRLAPDPSHPDARGETNG